MKKRDEFDDPKGSDLLGSVGPKAAFFIVLIALSFMIGVVWKLYVGGGSVSSENVPIVRAESEPYKIVPDEAGGMEMPHKDSTIFSSLNSEHDTDNGIENLLADTDEEAPLPRSQLFAGLNTEPNPDLHAEAQETPLDQPLSEGEERIISQAKEAEKVVTNLFEDGVDALVSTEDVPIKVHVPEKVEPAMSAEDEAFIEAEINSPEHSATEEKMIKDFEALAKAESQSALEKPKPEPKVAPKPVIVASKINMGSGDYYIQLGSVRTRDGADSEWHKLKSKYSSALSGYSYRVETANLGAKGTFYRIQAGPVSKVQATSACNAIKRKSPSGCLVKKK